MVRRRRESRARARDNAAARASGAPGGQVNPVTPSVIWPDSPCAVVVTTGPALAANASIGILPNGSARDGTITARIPGWVSIRGTAGVNRCTIVASMPSSAMRAARCR
nr:hypothetical protein [Nocardia terpenica]